MDCNLTLGKEAYKAVAHQVMDVRKRASAISAELLRSADRDARSFDAVMRALSMPRITELQKLKRFERVQAALKRATEVPMQIMILCAELGSMADFMASSGNRSSRSDALVGGIFAHASMKGAYENLEINLESIKDESYVEEMSRKAQELMKSPAQLVR
jgi:formiminotetrahydrofolate cyclodeaminase